MAIEDGQNNMTEKNEQSLTKTNGHKKAGKRVQTMSGKIRRCEGRKANGV